jgi:hypothetical protein
MTDTGLRNVIEFLKQQDLRQRSSQTSFNGYSYKLVSPWKGLTIAWKIFPHLRKTNVKYLFENNTRKSYCGLSILVRSIHRIIMPNQYNEGWQRSNGRIWRQCEQGENFLSETQVNGSMIRNKIERQ